MKASQSTFNATGPIFIILIKRMLSHLFPKDFIECIKDIYTINKARNEVLLTEAKELSELLYMKIILNIFFSKGPHFY